ncbi:MAG: beta-lactamase family protein [Sphingomonadales bacterium]|nr:beta-lactamase family protein [Sphingomonadales bacterium]
MSDHDLSRRNLLRGTAWLGGALALSGLPSAQVLGRSMPRKADMIPWPTVTAMLDKYVTERKVAGMVAELGWGDKPALTIARGKEGFDDKDAVGPNSLFRAYSQTKPVTGIAAMLLIEEGKLKLDQPIADFAPEFARMRVAIDPDKSLDSRPTDKLITVRHLLTHTAGLGYAGIGKNKAITAELGRLGLVPAIVSAKPFPGQPITPPVPEADEFLRRTASVPLCFEPGRAWRYSMALDVLGLIIQRAAGAKSFAAFLQDRLFGPLGMDSTTFTVPDKSLPRLTTNYALMGSMRLPIDQPQSSIYRKPTPFAYGGAGLVTSPADFDRFLAMLVNDGLHRGKRIMKAETVALATSDLLPAGADLSGTWVVGQGFGAGGVSGKGKDEGLFGWSGAAGTIGFANRKLGLRTGLYVQYMPQETLPILSEFPKAVGQDLTLSAVPRK